MERSAELDMFSGTVLVAKDGHTIFEGAYGEANKDFGIPNSLNTKFNIGSIGKSFTAVAIMQLVESGRLKLSDPLSKYLPAAPFTEKDRITIHHLLTHTSGLGDYLEHEDYLGTLPGVSKITDVLPLVYDQAAQFAPGEQFAYSNSGYLLLGVIIEEVSGLPYPEYLQQNIFEPSGMTESGLFYESEVLPGRSIGYTKTWDGSYVSNVVSVPAPCPAGGLRTTVNDLLKFDQALLGSTLLSESSRATMYRATELRPTYACGWEIKEYHGHKFVGHSGGANGIEAYFYRFINDGYTIVTLSNYDGGNGQVCSDIEAIIFGQDYSLPTITDADFTLGYFLHAKGKYREAVKVLDRNLSRAEPHLLSLFFSADSRMRGEFELEKALEQLDLYIELAPENSFPPITMIWSRKGRILTDLGRAEEAMESYEALLRIDPENSNAREKLKELTGIEH
ncbi:MAG: class A beta-lactamase-related serine hydrolase [Candidatus Zixiibacteriota bacterium]|nr:MAG: class A beta-lactamase-related serine hydrolase [candidate division Zixibacteria bacterium]